jgi:hypothetical protein
MPARAQGFSAPEEAAVLRERIAELEQAIAATNVVGTAGAPASPVTTDAYRELGSRAAAGSGDAAVVEALLRRIDERDGPGLLAELESLLLSGERGLPTLLDLCLRLDADPQRALAVVGVPQVSFSLAHLALRHEVEAARCAHYLLAATRGAEQPFTRSLLFRWFPVLLRFHRGKLPDLERDYREAILARLGSGKGDLAAHYAAMSALECWPPVPVLEGLLGQARGLQQIAPPLEALEKIDDGDAALALRRLLDAPRPARDIKVTMILASLARMEHGEAVRLLDEHLRSPSSALRVEAHRAYFSLPRDADSLPLLVELLNTESIPAAQKGQVIAILARRNPRLLASLKASSDRIEAPEVQKLIFLEGQRLEGQRLEGQRPDGPRPGAASKTTEPEQKGNP